MNEDKDILHLAHVLDLKIDNITIQLKSNEKALELQAKEVERRLETLNNETGRIKAMEIKYVDKEVYAADLKTMNTKIDSHSRMLYIGLGILILANILLAIFYNSGI